MKLLTNIRQSLTESTPGTRRYAMYMRRLTAAANGEQDGERKMVMFIHNRHCSRVQPTDSLDTAIDRAIDYSKGQEGADVISEILDDWNKVVSYGDLDAFVRGFRPLQEAGPDRLSFLTAKERKQINAALHANPIFGGIKKVYEARDAISPLAEALTSVGFTLDMVSGDLLMGDRGSRQLSFRRLHPEAFEEHPMIDNSRISFTWEDLGYGRNNAEAPSVEIIAYVS